MGVNWNDDHAILSCDSHERVCGNAPRSFYFYDWVVRKDGIEIPFTYFQMKVFGHLNVAPTQLSPGGWGFVVTFEKFCSHLGLEPSLYFFFHLYQRSRLKRADGTRDAVKLPSAPDRPFVKPVANSYGHYRTKFCRVAVPSGHTVWWEEIVDGVVQERFPSVWRENPDSPSYFSAFQVPEGRLSDVERGVLKFLVDQMVPNKDEGEVHLLESSVVLFKKPHMTRSILRRISILDSFSCFSFFCSCVDPFFLVQLRWRSRLF